MSAGRWPVADAKFQVGDKVRIDFDEVGGVAPYHPNDVVTVRAIRFEHLNDGHPRTTYLVSGDYWLPEVWLCEETAQPKARTVDDVAKGLAFVVTSHKLLIDAVGAVAQMAALLDQRLKLVEERPEPELRLIEPTPAPVEEPKPFEIDGPGEYRTRDGRTACVTGNDSTPTWPWTGTLDGRVEYWSDNGHWDDADTEHQLDLVEKVT